MSRIKRCQNRRLLGRGDRVLGLLPEPAHRSLDALSELRATFDGFYELAERFSTFGDHMVPLAPLATVAVGMLIVTGLSVMLHGLWDMLFGAPPPEPWPAGISAWPEAPR